MCANRLWESLSSGGTFVQSVSLQVQQLTQTQSEFFFGEMQPFLPTSPPSLLAHPLRSPIHPCGIVHSSYPTSPSSVAPQKAALSAQAPPFMREGRRLLRQVPRGVECGVRSAEQTAIIRVHFSSLFGRVLFLHRARAGWAFGRRESAITESDITESAITNQL